MSTLPVVWHTFNTCDSTVHGDESMATATLSASSCAPSSTRTTSTVSSLARPTNQQAHHEISVLVLVQHGAGNLSVTNCLGHVGGTHLFLGNKPYIFLSLVPFLSSPFLGSLRADATTISRPLPNANQAAIVFLWTESLALPTPQCCAFLHGEAFGRLEEGLGLEPF